MSDLYPRPSREEIAARVIGRQPGTANGDDDLGDVVTRREPKPEGDVLTWFGAHVRATLAARGWTVRELAEHTGDPAGNLSQAINGTKCPLAIAGRIAGAFGVSLAEMVVPYTCRTCAGYGGKPPKGTGCLECGAETRAS